MLATRIIPTLLCRGRQLIKGTQFNSWRSVGVAAQAVRIHQARGVDELVLLDIAATPENRTPDLSLVEELSTECFMPLAVGGGIKSLDDIQNLLNAGADKVVIGTSAMKDIHLVRDAANKYGSQAITVSIDYIGHEVYVGCGKEKVGQHPAFVAMYLEKLGAGEIILTDISREGTMTGYDLETIRAVSDAVDIPVIANGGCGTYAHMLEAIKSGAHAVAAGAMFQFEDATPKGAALYISQHGVETRL